ncbi:transposable element Tcb2 transposase [Trichonephila clavipes]|nr:transposable element Tcb2 transposase [Trichonephila clavipes]
MCLLETYEDVWWKDIWDCVAHYVFCPRRPHIDASVWSGAAHKETGLQRNGTRSSLAMNPDSILAVMAIVFAYNALPHTARVSQDYLRTVTTLPWPARSPDLSPIEHIWDHLGRRVGHSTSLNELETSGTIAHGGSTPIVPTSIVVSVGAEMQEQMFQSGGQSARMSQGLVIKMALLIYRFTEGMKGLVDLVQPGV